MTERKKTVLITGCSDGGLGAGLAVAFHNAGLHVYATARTPSKMKYLASLGIETLQLDVLSDSSIAECLSKVPQLDILVNNAGAAYTMPFSDVSITDAKKTFDLNVWSYLAVSQAFLPLLLESKGMIVNHTSIASVIAVPFQSIYNASKSAMAMLSDIQRLELAPFGVKVVDIKTGTVKSNIMVNHAEANHVLPKGSLYEIAKDEVSKAMTGEHLMDGATPTDVWADTVVRKLLKKSPPPIVWAGGFYAWLAWFVQFLQFGTLDGMVTKIAGIDVVAKRVQKQKQK